MYLIKSSSFKLLFFLLLDLSWISKIQVNKPAVLRRAEQIQARRPVKKEWQVRAFLKNSFPCFTGLISSLEATRLNFTQAASQLKRLQLSMTYFNNSYMMKMGWRKITCLSKQVKILSFLSGKAANEFEAFLFMSELNGIFSQHTYSVS